MSQINIIADAGSTKTDWIVTDISWHVLRHVSGQGINVMQLSESELKAQLTDLQKELKMNGKDINAVYFYGAGCTSGAVSTRTSEILKSVFRANKTEAYSDMLGAARALFSTGSGIACILGTGSNSCLYNGAGIVRNVPPLGYILGDEGSGVRLGRRLIADIYRGILPRTLQEHFEAHTQLTLDDIYKGIYRSSNPRELLSSVVPYLAAYHEEIKEYNKLVLDEFNLFLNRNVALYPEAKELSVGFVGGVAEAFSGILAKACNSCGVRLNRICRRPINDLLTYHSQSR